MNKTIVIMLLILVGLAAPDFCSAYCNQCNGITYLDCINCPANFIETNGECRPDSAISVVFLETNYSTATFSETRTWTCGRFDKIPGLYPPEFSVTLYNSAISPHYSIRVLSFILWIDNWASTSVATMTLDGAVVGTGGYSSAFNGGDECKKSTS